MSLGYEDLQLPNNFLLVLVANQSLFVAPYEPSQYTCKFFSYSQPKLHTSLVNTPANSSLTLNPSRILLAHHTGKLLQGLQSSPMGRLQMASRDITCHHRAYTSRP
jgi:hypothetical protein